MSDLAVFIGMIIVSVIMGNCLINAMMNGLLTEEEREVRRILKSPRLCQLHDDECRRRNAPDPLGIRTFHVPYTIKEFARDRVFERLCKDYK